MSLTRKLKAADYGSYDANQTPDRTFKYVLASLLNILKKDVELRNVYIMFFSQLALFIFYLFVMAMQFNTSNSRALTTSIAQAVVPPQYDVSFMDWLKTQVVEVWKDPLCGNGICEAPHEFSSFGRFGCEADCGVATDVTSILIYVEVDFFQLDKNLPLGQADLLRRRATWNVCLHDEVRRMRGLPELCWYEKNQVFRKMRERFLKSLNLKQVTPPVNFFVLDDGLG
ncbi:TRP-like ion channel Pkd2 [Cymbomonas tetramitiformis]|uniref:TRP-like ion channel Pkd2 n=1 Tax=Cymbomonas tetramitiformis TaxID=36881 RepID=A0AAE0GEM2_9CHLO|nr:TRP-like ion channel Pkd2 [Cymbomonas tetramitiformis]